MPSVDLKNRLPSFWSIQLVGWVVYFVVIYITFLTIAQPENFLNLLFLKGFRALTGLILTSFILRPIYRSFRTQLWIFRLILLVLTCVIVLGVVWTAIEAIYIYFNYPDFNVVNYLARSPRLALDYAMTLTAWSALYLGVKNWLAWQDEREKALQLTVLADKSQLEMLRYQINPHFLFNALNSIRASVDEDSNRAKQMITQMSEFLRYSLLSESKKKIPLREEIEAVRNYLAIEKIRFEDKLAVDFNIEKAAEDFEVPCFLLNPLVENAVKYGWQTSSKPLKISITARFFDNKLLLEVSNSGKSQTALNENGTKIGLQNVRERLEKLFGENAKFELKQDGEFVKACIEVFDETQNNHR